MEQQYRIPEASAFKSSLKRKREEAKSAEEAKAAEQFTLYRAEVLEEVKTLMGTVRDLVLERRFCVCDSEIAKLKHKEAVMKRVPVRYSSLAGAYVITSDVVAKFGPTEQCAYNNACDEQQELFAKALEGATKEMVHIDLPICRLHPKLKQILEEQGYWILDTHFRDKITICPKATRRVVYEPIEPEKQ